MSNEFLLLYQVIVTGSFFFGQLCDLYENDSIFDKFECCLSGDGLRVSTGSYRYGYKLNLSVVLSFLSLLLTILFHLIPAIYSVCLVVFLEVLRL